MTAGEGPDAETQTGHSNFTVKDGESLWCCFTAISVVNARPSLVLVPHLNFYYSGSGKKLLTKATVLEVVETPTISVSIGPEYPFHVVTEPHGKHCIWYYGYVRKRYVNASLQTENYEREIFYVPVDKRLKLISELQVHFF